MDVSTYDKIESDLIFYGLVGIKDQARPEVRHSIEQCREAWYRVFMITGDNKVRLKLLLVMWAFCRLVRKLLVLLRVGISLRDDG